MKKYTVAVTEVIEYLVPVECKNARQAERAGLSEIENSADRDKYFVDCRDREVEGVNEVDAFDPPGDLGATSRALSLCGTLARMTPYTIDASDDQLEDAIATLNRLIREARAVAG